MPGADSSLHPMPGADHAIEIEFPSELDLSIGESAPVALSARWVRGQTSETTPGPVLHAWASFGEIRGWKREGAVWRGEWVPPQPLVPGYLVIVVSALIGGHAAFSAAEMPVSAEIDLPGHSEAGAQVTILLAGEKFGPVVAGKDGRFSVRVRVPPGVQEATAQTRDALGNTFKRKADLFVPKTSRLGLVCPVAVMTAGERVPIVLATDRARTGQVSYEASLGKVELGRFVAPEKLERAAKEAATATVTSHSSTLGDASCSIEVVPSVAVSLATTFEPPYVLADGKSTTELKVTALDKFGNATSDAEISVLEDKALQPLRYDDKAHAFVARIVSRAGAEQRTFAVSAQPLAHRCEPREVRDDVDFRGVSCHAGNAAAGKLAVAPLAASAVLEQIPARGVVMRAQRLPNGQLSLTVTPPGEANAQAVKAVDDHGDAIALSAGTHTGELLAARAGKEARFVSFTHLKSGVSVMFSLSEGARAQP